MNAFSVDVQKVPGGFIISCPDGIRVETDLVTVLQIVQKELSRELVSVISTV